MSKTKLLEYMDRPVGVENWYNSYYAISQTFSRDEIEAMSDSEVSHLIKLGDAIAEALY